MRSLLVGIGTEVELLVATTLDKATVIRVVNLAGSDQTVSIAKSTTTGYASTATVTLPDNTIEFFEKGANDLISAQTNGVKGFKVGFTG